MRQSRSITTDRNSPEIRKKSGIRNGFGEGDQHVHEAGLAGGQFHAQHRMHHHHHDNADALGVIDQSIRSATADVPFTVIGVPF